MRHETNPAPTVTYSINFIEPESTRLTQQTLLPERFHRQIHRKLPKVSRRFSMLSKNWELGRQHDEWGSE